MKPLPWMNKRQAEEGTHEVASWSDLRQEMERMYETYLREPVERIGRGFESLAPWGPALDIAESDQAVTVRVEIPGVEPSEIDLQVTGNQLTIAGEKKEHSQHAGEDFFHSERRFGKFRRSVQLPVGIDAEQVTAEYDHGVLTVRLPKSQGVKPKRVEVRSPASNAM
ncbi:MAG: Hsp20/alpha crystallin family protein [Pirellulales bacterium]|nr:Hsp20/alpha crystallin family protein [Pirellulales bacterium]